MRYIISILSSGLVIGSIYSLMALGLSLVYSVLGIINFAHGEFYMLGGYMLYYLLTGFTALNPAIAVLLSGLIVTSFGIVVERLLLRPMHAGRIERPDEYSILITIGLAFFLQNAAIAVFGPYPSRPPSFIEGTVRIGYLQMSADRLIVSIMAVLMMAVMFLAIRGTWLGKALRAVSQDKDGAAVVGIDPLRMNTIAFGVGVGLAAISGALLAPVFSVTPTSGSLAGIRSYVIIVLGGLGSIPGTVAGGLIIGLVESIGAGYFPDPNRALVYKSAWGLLIFAAILLFRPRGLFGRAE